MRPPEVLRGNLGLSRGGSTYMPYGYIVAEVRGQETTPYQVLMDTGSSLILLVMDAAEELLDKTRDEIVANRDHEQRIVGLSGGSIGCAWKTTLRLRSHPGDKGGMPIPDAWIYAVDCRNIAGYPALFGQKSGFEQRWFKQHNHSASRYWQLREWR